MVHLCFIKPNPRALVLFLGGKIEKERRKGRYYGSEEGGNFFAFLK